jgi:actin-like ATPase involved in cell morphogenesis
MTLTLHLPPAVEAQLLAAAEASGKKVPDFVVDVVEAHLAGGTASLRNLLAPVHDEVRRSGLAEAELDALLADELAASRADRSGV